MKTLIIYDNEGYIISTIQGYPSPRVPVGIPYLEVDIPQGKQIKVTDGIGINVSKTPHEVILEDIPPTEMDLMKEENAELIMKSAITDMEIETVKNENSEIMLRLANLEMGGIL